ncbi:MAG: FAD-binding oxidoreductase [Pseudonocardia sp.]|nr:FAD-binding oxidoreductase [Pseudonocardia sp.]
MNISTLLTAGSRTAPAAGRVYLPGDPGYDTARQGFNVSVDQRPAAVGYPETATEVADAVRVAVEHGLRVAVWTTGHNPGPLGDLRDTLLLRTDRMRTVQVDPTARRVRAAAGARWDDVVAAVAPHGLSVLHGSSPTVGVTGYSLGGGIGWYARALGLAAHRITAAQLVLADGTLVRTSDSEHPALIWALRGGGASVGIVTELEFEAFGFDTAYAGRLAWDLSQARKVLPVWAGWAAHAPREVTTSFRLLALPPLPTIPAELRGRRLVMIDGAVLGGDPDAERILAPLRALHPEVDTFTRTPTPALTRLHLDPEEAVPVVTDSLMLHGLPTDAVEAFLAAAGPESASSLLLAEIRQLGGALADPHPERAALSRLSGRFLLFAAGLAVDDAAAAAVERDVARVVAAVQPWGTGRTYLNFVERPSDTATAFTAQAWARLQRLRATYDPRGVLHTPHTAWPR